MLDSVIVVVEELRRRKEYTFCFRWLPITTNMHLQTESSQMAMDQGKSFDESFSRREGEGTIVNIK